VLLHVHVMPSADSIQQASTFLSIETDECPASVPGAPEAV